MQYAGCTVSLCLALCDVFVSGTRNICIFLLHECRMDNVYMSTSQLWRKVNVESNICLSPTPFSTTAVGDLMQMCCVQA